MVSWPQYLFILFLLWYLSFVHFTAVVQTKWKTSIGLVNSAMSYHLRPIWSLVRIILNVMLYDAIALIIVKPILHMNENSVSWVWKCFWNNLIRNRNFHLFFKYLFIFLHLVLFCDMWDLVPWPGIEPWSLALGEKKFFFPFSIINYYNYCAFMSWTDIFLLMKQ